MYSIDTNMAHARSFIASSTNIPKIDNAIYELLGVCLGDGCLSTYFSKYDKCKRYEVKFTGNSNYDLQYYKNFLTPILKSKFNIRLSYRVRKDCNAINMDIHNKQVFMFFKDIGMPIGDKKNKIMLPPKTFSLPKKSKAAILRGLLDTDGCIFARKDEEYKYPHLEISSGTLKFLLQLKKLIRQFGIPAYVHWTNGHGGNVLLRGSKNVKLWMKQIGSSHPVIKERYNKWLTEGILLPKGLVA